MKPGFLQLSALALPFVLGACGETTGDRAVSGAGLGAGTGAVLGAATGGNAGAGALIGGAVGGIGGAATSPGQVDLGKAGLAVVGEETRPPFLMFTLCKAAPMRCHPAVHEF